MNCVKRNHLVTQSLFNKIISISTIVSMMNENDHKMHMQNHLGGGSPDHSQQQHPMTFSFSTQATLLFRGIQVGPDIFSYGISLIIVVCLGILRQELVKLAESDEISLNKRVVLYFAQATLSYLLMLISMTFNVGLFFAVIVGLTLGWYRCLLQTKIKTDCCS